MDIDGLVKNIEIVIRCLTKAEKNSMIIPEKDCFGVLDEVFPMGKEGLREIVPGCFDCPHKKACLQAALDTKEGIEFRGEVLDRTPAGGLAGRLRRWSDKKQLSRLMQQEETKRK
ncbi:MAG: hypothetical protein JRF53_07010 [Deltaproteobacteria bacterium]|nr:hypothetical protein [Deltaproteobacteria bacterium]